MCRGSAGSYTHDRAEDNCSCVHATSTFNAIAGIQPVVTGRNLASICFDLSNRFTGGTWEMVDGQGPERLETNNQLRSKPHYIR
jgi:hypothetical protein